jgi:hypothetical protein
MGECICRRQYIETLQIVGQLVENEQDFKYEVNLKDEKRGFCLLGCAVMGLQLYYLPQCEYPDSSTETCPHTSRFPKFINYVREKGGHS